jgi:hypothetical protein
MTHPQMVRKVPWVGELDGAVAVGTAVTRDPVSSWNEACVSA